MKKLYLCTIIGYSGWGYVLIILFELCGIKAGLHQFNLLWVGKHEHSPSPKLSYYKKN